MSSGPAWLSLKTVPKPPAGASRSTTLSVPKKIVRLATQRNRLKRLCREALRTGDFQLSEDKVYHFRVIRMPGAIGMRDAQSQIRSLLKEK